MRKFYTLGLALAAVFAFCAMAAATAFAVNPEWLINGNAVTALTSVVTTGELLLEDMNVPLIGAAGATCKGGSFVGSVGPNGEDEITEVLNAAGEALGQGLTAPNFICTGEGACAAEADVELKPENLPWHTQLELNASGQIVDHLFGTGAAGGEPAWDVMNCLTPFGAQGDLCEGLNFALVENMLTNGVSDLLANFEEAAPTEAATCEKGGAGSGLLNSLGTGLISALTGELTVSGDGITD